MDVKHITHLYWRGGFGPDISDLERLGRKKRSEVVDELLNRSKPFDPLDIAEKPGSPLFAKYRDMDRDEKRALRKFNLEELMRMNLTMMNYFTFGTEQLREKAGLFWHDHFACFVPWSYMMQLHANKLRKYALGSFRDLLHTIAKDAAMLEFLNNLQNKKSSPNENFARELMELYTLGIGHYTEQDIKEAARAFTGWAYDEDGDFYLREKQHDTGSKTFRGQTGNFTGEDIINMILDDPACAQFITRKIWSWFVSDIPDEQRIEELAKWYFENNYDTGGLLKQIFMADWFYADYLIGCRIKSPIELITGLRRQFAIEFRQENVLLYIQKVLGQVYGHPPNVAGWDDGKPWIDSSTLIFRMRLGDALFANADLDFEDKDVAEETRYSKLFKKFNSKVTLSHIYRLTDHEKPEQAAALLTERLIQPVTPMGKAPNVTYEGYIRDYVYEYIRQLLRSPEYQMC